MLRGKRYACYVYHWNGQEMIVYANLQVTYYKVVSMHIRVIAHSKNMYKETYPNQPRGWGCFTNSLLHKLKIAPQKKNDAWKTSPSSLEFFLFRGGRTVQLQGVSIPPCCFVCFCSTSWSCSSKAISASKVDILVDQGLLLVKISVCVFFPLPKLGSFSFKIAKTPSKSRGPHLLFLTCFTYDLAPMPPINLSYHQHKTRTS